MSLAQTHWRWPALAATMPWPKGFALLARIASEDRVRFAAEEAAFANARAFDGLRLPETDGAAADEMQWRRAWRLVQLVDHADLFVTWTRSSRWITAYVATTGAWPAAGPFLAVTCHWGAGLWALRHLADSGHRSHFLARSLDEDAPLADPWRRRYARLRISATERAAGAPVIYTGGATDKIVAAWGAGRSIVALCDVPMPPGRQKIRVPFRGGTLAMPLGLIALACERNIPVVTFAAGVDRATGLRRVEIGPAGTFANPEAMGAALARQLARLIERDSAAWHMWPHAEHMIA